MYLPDAEIGTPYTITGLDTDDEDMDTFLLRLGCYPGEQITLIRRAGAMYTVVIKNGRYTIDAALANSIVI